jgi:glycerate dehydrogenase
MTEQTLLVTYPTKPHHRETIEAALPDGLVPIYLEELNPDARAAAVADADALLAWSPHGELGDAFDALSDDHVVQLITAGVDHLPLDRFPDGLTLLSNAGAYAEPMAEHVLAIYLALSKRLLIEHRKLQDGEFDQFRPNKWVRGSTCGIIGYGAIGEATARLLKRLNVSVMAINRSGEADEPVDFLGTPADLEHVLAEADGVVLAAPLTDETRGMIDRERLELLPDDGLLINVARGELVVQRDLFEHLQDHPDFQAGLEAWWTEPVRHGEFDLEYPLLDLPNVLGCPHNSAQVPDIRERAHRHGVPNVVAALTEDEAENLVDRERGY